MANGLERLVAPSLTPMFVLSKCGCHMYGRGPRYGYISPNSWFGVGLGYTRFFIFLFFCFSIYRVYYVLYGILCSSNENSFKMCWAGGRWFNVQLVSFLHTSARWFTSRFPGEQLSSVIKGWSASERVDP